MFARLISLIGAVLMTLLLFYATLPNLFTDRGVETGPLNQRSAPPFDADQQWFWINSEPLRWKDLRGKVVLLMVFNYDCANCIRSLPWLNSLQRSYADRGFQIIGVHTPETEAHRDRKSIVAGVDKLGIEFPVLLDNQFHYWRALENRYWPSWYLVDSQGQLSERFVGETQSGDAGDQLIRSAIEALLPPD